MRVFVHPYWDGWFCEGQYQSASIEVWALYYFIS